MTDTKTTAETAAGTLDGTELVRIVQAGNNKKATTQAIADLGGASGVTFSDGTHTVAGATILTVENATISGAAPNAILTPAPVKQISIASDNTQTTEITLDTSVRAMRVGVTTDGSGLAQVIDVPNFALDAHNQNTAMNGYLVTVTCDVETDLSDYPLVTINGGDTIAAYTLDGHLIATWTNTRGPGSGPVKSIPLYAGGSVTFVWHDAGWEWDDSTFNNLAAEAPAIRYPVVDGSGNTSLTSAGDLTLAVGAGKHHKLDLAHLPTADPNVAGALFTVGAPSAGVPQQIWISGG